MVKTLLCRFRQPMEIPQTQVLQGLAAFRLALPRIPPRHSQTTRATNCANPGFWGIQFCSRCGQTCGQAVFLTTSACGGSAFIVGVSRDCGHGIFRLEGGATRSQIKRDTSFATPGYLVLWGVILYMGRCAGDTACKATAWSIDSADAVCMGRCGGDNAYPTMFCGKKQQGAGRKSAAPFFG